MNDPHCMYSHTINACFIPIKITHATTVTVIPKYHDYLTYHVIPCDRCVYRCINHPRMHISSPTHATSSHYNHHRIYNNHSVLQEMLHRLVSIYHQYFKYNYHPHVSIWCMVIMIVINHVTAYITCSIASTFIIIISLKHKIITACIIITAFNNIAPCNCISSSLHVYRNCMHYRHLHHTMNCMSPYIIVIHVSSVSLHVSS